MRGFLLFIVLLASQARGVSTESVPYVLTKVCDPLELYCADVTSTLKLKVEAAQTGTYAVTQSTSPWVTSRNWTLSNGTDSIAAVQSGTWATRLQDGTGNAISSTTGALNVNVTNSFAAGTADRTTFTYGTTIQNAIGGVYQDTSPSVTAGQGAAVRITQFRGLHMNLRDGSGNELGITANPVKTDPTGTTPQPVTQSGTWTVQQGTPPWSVGGNVASGAADSGNPQKTGGVFNTTQPTVTTGQRVDAQMTSRGAQIVATGIDAFNINNITGTVSLPTGASTSAIQTTQLTALQIIDNLPHSNDSALNQGIPMMGQRDDISTGTVAENNVSTVRITPGRAQHTRPVTSPQFRVDFAAPAQAITGASYVQAYLYTGSGMFHGMVFSSNNDGLQLKLEIDGTTILTDISGTQLNSLGTLGNVNIGGGFYMIRVSSGTIAFMLPDPMPFGASVKVSAKRDTGAAITISSYIVYLAKET